MYSKYHSNRCTRISVALCDDSIMTIMTTEAPTIGHIVKACINVFFAFRRLKNVLFFCLSERIQLWVLQRVADLPYSVRTPSVDADCVEQKIGRNRLSNGLYWQWFVSAHLTWLQYVPFVWPTRKHWITTGWRSFVRRLSVDTVVRNDLLTGVWYMVRKFAKIYFIHYC